MAGDVELNCLAQGIVDVALKALLPTLLAKNDILNVTGMGNEGLSSVPCSSQLSVDSDNAGD